MNIETMSEQEIIEFLRNKGTSPKAIGVARSKQIEEFFNKHDIKVVCQHCNSAHYTKNGTNGSGITRLRCKACGKNFALTTNTLFDGMSYSFEEIVLAVHAVLNKQTMNYTSVNAKTDKMSDSAAWLLHHKILNILANIPMPTLSGVIQIDEKYFRETQKGSRKLVSYLNQEEDRFVRKHCYRSECGIFGPEFINVLCAVDNAGHYWAKCICLGPMKLDLLSELRKSVTSVAYICTDNYSIYSDWCEQNGFKHYVEPSTYRKERAARGYINTDDIYHSLTKEEYAKDEAINRQMYKEGIYPHLENTDHKLTFDEFIAVRSKFNLSINGINSFHNILEEYLVTAAKGVSSVYLPDYIGTLVYIMNYKSSHHIKSFSRQDAEEVLAEITKHTMSIKHVPTREELTSRNIDHLPRPSKKDITIARTRIKKARKTIVDVERKHDDYQNEFEGDNSHEFMFNRAKFFRSLGTTRINELAKLYEVYDRKEHKQTRIQRLCDLPNVDDIIFEEVGTSLYGTVDEMQERLSKKPEKKKRGRPKKTA